MRQRRLKAPASFPVAHYHCMSRVVNRDFVFGPQEREHFVRLLREYERFCGVHVLTYCILSNHFHLLVEVPARPEQPLSAEEVLSRIEALSSSALTPRRFRQRLDQFRVAGDSAGERAFLDRICAAMWDISGYLQRLKSLSGNSEGSCFRANGPMARREEGAYPSWVCDRRATKRAGRWRENPPGGRSFAGGRRWLGRCSPLRGCASLAAWSTAKIPRRRTPLSFRIGSKQRFTQWFNRRKGRRGVLWEERFKSVLVEGTGDPLSTMAAYIDLNPVRAGLVDDPKDYRWCGYGAAAAGDATARDALALVIAMAQRRPEVIQSPGESLATYRMWLFGQGEEREGTAPDGGSNRRGFSREAVLAVLASRGKVSLPEYLQLRVRYFADGAVLGTREYVDGVFHALRNRWGPNRTDGARPIKGLAAGADLCVLRDLRKQVFG